MVCWSASYLIDYCLTQNLGTWFLKVNIHITRLRNYNLYILIVIRQKSSPEAHSHATLSHHTTDCILAGGDKLNNRTGKVLFHKLRQYLYSFCLYLIHRDVLANHPKIADIEPFCDIALFLYSSSICHSSTSVKYW